MSATQSRFVDRPLRISVRFSDGARDAVAFFEDDGETDGYEAEVKRMIEFGGMVTPDIGMAAEPLDY